MFLSILVWFQWSKYVLFDHYKHYTGQKVEKQAINLYFAICDWKGYLTPFSSSFFED